jgi:hypothetical protein
MSRPAIVSLRTMHPAYEPEHAVSRNGSPGERQQPLFDIGRKRGCGDVEAQLDRRFLLSRVLATRANGSHETLLDFVTIEGDTVGHSQH